MTFAFWAKNNTPTAGTVTFYGYAAAASGQSPGQHPYPVEQQHCVIWMCPIPMRGTSYDRVGAANAVVTTGDPYWIYWIFTKDIETGVMRIYRNGIQVAQATGRTAGIMAPTMSNSVRIAAPRIFSASSSTV